MTPLSLLYKYGAVPPPAVTSISPSEEPKHNAPVAAYNAVNWVGSFTTWEVSKVQLLSSVTIIG